MPSDFLTSGFTVTVDQVTPENPPDQQNQFFLCGPAGGVFLCGDDVFVTIVDAPTSFARERATGFPNSQEPFTRDGDQPANGPGPRRASGRLDQRRPGLGHGHDHPDAEVRRVPDDHLRCIEQDEIGFR